MLHEYNNLGYYYQVWDDLPGDERQELLGLIGSAVGQDFADRGELDRYFAANPREDRQSIDAGCERLVIESATVAFVHSIGTVRFLRTRYPRSRIELLPFPVAEINPTCGAATRRRFGIAEDAYVFGLFGFIGKYKRVESVLAAWECWEDRPSNVVLLLAGERQYDISVPSSPLIRETGYLSGEDFDALLLAADCGVQLRYPCLGEISGPACALVAHGRPVILSDIPEMHSFAARDDVTYVPVGPQEVEALWRAMRLRYDSPKQAVDYDESFAWAAWTVALTSRLLAALGDSPRLESGR